MPKLDSGQASLHHLVVVDHSCTPSDIAALARSIYPDSGWTRMDELSLHEDAVLTGPWEIDSEARATLGLPDWAAQGWLAIVPQVRGGVLPLVLEGADPILDAYPGAIPEGVELQVLRFLLAVARRCAGALRLAGPGELLQPEAFAQLDLSVYSPGALEPAALLAGMGVAGENDAEIERAATGWSLSLPALPGLPAAGTIQVIHEPVQSGGAGVPFAISGVDWASRAHATTIRWHPVPSQTPADLSATDERIRLEINGHIEALAHVAATLSGGIVIDDDGFIVTLG